MVKGFVVYPTYQIENGKAKIHLFGRLENGESFLTISSFRPYFFILKKDLDRASKIHRLDHEDVSLVDYDGEPVVKLVTDIPKDVPTIREHFEDQGIKTFEADIRFAYRFMMDNGIKGSVNIEGEYSPGEKVDRIYVDPKISGCDYAPENLKVLSYDIETDSKAHNIFCISLYMEGYEEVLMVSKESVEGVSCFDNEKKMLEAFVSRVVEKDPDIITGWNVIGFDFDVIRNKMHHHKIPFKFGRNDRDSKLIVQTSFFRESKADICGRQVLDGIALLKNSFIKLDNYKLNTAAKFFLGDEKLLVGDARHEEIQTLYKEDKKSLADYNLKDSVLAYDVIYKSDALQLTIQRSLLTGMPLDRVGASVASLDYVYLIEARSKGIVCPSAKYNEREERITGGFVMDSKPGVYDYLLVLDFKSLYPSIIRSFNIDPASYVVEKPVGDYNKKKFVQSPNGAFFKNTDGLMPDIIDVLWKQRDEARKKGNELARFAIKILMNSFFGVLANPSCRFYNLEIANAITHFGQFLNKLTSEKIKEKGYDVIYGDTDSIFVDSKTKYSDSAFALGLELQNYINDFYSKFVTNEYSRKNMMELEFEKVYKKFIMPTVRGTDHGAKKRYAGLRVDNKGKEKLEIVGMEFVRSDWTEAAKKFQFQLFNLFFRDKEIMGFIAEYVKDLKAGQYDDLLVYSKSLTKDLDEYVKTTPPHVKAARMLDKLESRKISYYITVNGPEPIQKHTSPLDYDHYVEKQIKPIADTLLSLLHQSFDDVVRGSQQKSLFQF
jgi:DNA polymerase II